MSNLKWGKSSGPDGILPEHISYGDMSLKMWLRKIFNMILEHECIPPCFNNAIIVPIYKGKGKNPLSTNNYKEISLTSVIGDYLNVFCFKEWPQCWKRMESLFTHSLHTKLAFPVQIPLKLSKKLSEVIYNTALQCTSASTILKIKAFDSVEYCTLLDHLYQSSVNGKSWRLIRSFYTNPCGQVRVCRQLSNTIHPISWDKIGLVLSPVFFPLVIDSLLTELQNANQCWHSINGTYTGFFGHADDLRSVAPSIYRKELPQTEYWKANGPNIFLAVHPRTDIWH